MSYSEPSPRRMSRRFSTASAILESFVEITPPSPDVMFFVA
jgi:hypothetical protein